MAPKDENELQQMLYTSLQQHGPVVIRYPRGSGEGVSLKAAFSELEIGKGELLREGRDVLLIPIGNRVTPALMAAEQLQTAGIEAAVINPRFIKPLDEKLICTWAKQTGRVITIEDNCAQGGFGSGVLEMLSQQGLQVPVTILGYGDAFVEQGPQPTLWADAGLDAEGIARKVGALLNKA